MNPVSNLDRSVIGFWIYLMTDCVLFASLFATFAVLRSNTNGGPSGATLFDLRFVFIETLVLLTSSFSCGLALLSARRGQLQAARIAMTITGLLGVLFVGMEVSEFHKLVLLGDSWRRSGFLSAYFTLVATHGLHICIGLLWLITLLWQLHRQGLSVSSHKRLQLFSMFWHFLDLIWIFIFSIVYLWGKAL